MPSPDPRTQRTRRRLHESLGSLIHERPYEDIHVQHILDRADVSRSTFYSHFSDKDDLLVAGIAQICGAASSDPLAFTGAVFEHIAKHRDHAAPSMRAAGQWTVHQRLEEVVERQVLRTLRGLDAAARSRGDEAPIPAELRARHVARTLTMVLEWWLASEPGLDAREVNAVFRRLAAP